MFPIRDHNPAERTPYVNYALIAINVVVFISYSQLLSNPVALSGFFADWAIIPASVTRGDGYHGLLSSMFLHGGWMHLLGNMLFLYIFGDNLEDILGHVGYLAFYLVAGLGAGILQIISAPYSQIPVVGASGAIAGVMGAYLLMFPRARVDVLFIIVIVIRIVPVPAWVMLGVWFGLQVFSGTISDPSGGGVAYWAHAGGFVVGMLLMLPVWLARGGPAFWNRTDGHPDNPEARYRLVSSSVPKTARRRSEPTANSRVPSVKRRR